MPVVRVCVCSGKDVMFEEQTRAADIDVTVPAPVGECLDVGTVTRSCVVAVVMCRRLGV